LFNVGLLKFEISFGMIIHLKIVIWIILDWKYIKLSKLSEL